MAVNTVQLKLGANRKSQRKSGSHLGHSEGDVSHVEASGLSRHLTANDGHLCGRCRHAGRGGGRQQGYRRYLSGRWRGERRGKKWTRELQIML